MTANPPLKSNIQFTRSAWITAIGALLFLTILAVLEPQTFFWDDNLCQFFPWYEFDYQAFRHGEIPQINYYQYLGQTYLSNAQNGFFYPPVLIAMILAHAVGAPELGGQWLAWVHLTLAAVAFERLAREFGVQANRAVLCSWLFLTTPYLICSSQAFDLHPYVAFYVTLTILLLEQLRKKLTITRLLLLGIVKALFILSGHINYFALSLLFEGLFIVLRKENYNQLWAMSGAWIASFFFSVLGSLPSLGPTLYHLSTAADRSSTMPLDRVLDLTISPLAIFGAQAGVFLNQTYIFQAAWYFLGGSLIFWPLGIIQFRKDAGIRTCSILMIAALIFCTDAFYLIHLLPGYHSFRWAGKCVLFAMIFYSLGVGLICERFKDEHTFWVRPLFILGISTNFFFCLDPRSHLSVIETVPRFGTTFHLPLNRLQSARTQAITMSKGRSFDPNFLTYNFASLARVPVLNGYDALVNGQNKREALKEEYIGLPWKLSSAHIKHMRDWSVRYYLFDEIAPNPPVDLPETHDWQCIGKFGSVVVWEDPEAKPLAYFEDTPGISLPVTIDGNQLVINTGNPIEGNSTRTLSLGWVPLEGYQTWNGDSPKRDDLRPVQSATSGRMRIVVPPSANQIIVQYQEPFLSLYIGVTIVFYAMALLAIYLDQAFLRKYLTEVAKS